MPNETGWRELVHFVRTGPPAVKWRAAGIVLAVVITIAVVVLVGLFAN
jgi:hypothetical protein